MASTHAGLGQEFGGELDRAGPPTSGLWGLFDVHGHVWEWVHDRFIASDPDAVDQVDPVHEEGGQLRVHRGGSYASASEDARPASRNGEAPWRRTPTIGFRHVLRPSPPADP